MKYSEGAIKEILREKLRIGDLKEINGEDELKKDLGADSLDHIEVVMEIETKLNIEITDEEAGAMNTVGDIYTFLDKYKK